MTTKTILELAMAEHVNQRVENRHFMPSVEEVLVSLDFAGAEMAVEVDPRLNPALSGVTCTSCNLEFRADELNRKGECLWCEEHRLYFSYYDKFYYGEHYL